MTAPADIRKCGYCGSRLDDTGGCQRGYSGCTKARPFADIRLTADEAYALLDERVGGAAVARRIGQCHVRGCDQCLADGDALLRWIAERLARPEGT